MKNLVPILLFLLINFLNLQLASAQIQELKEKYPEATTNLDSIKHCIGQTKTIIAQITDIYISRAGHTFIRFGGNYKTQKLKIFIAEYQEGFQLNLQEGQWLKIKAKIEEFEGNPNIKFENVYELEILETQTNH